MDEAEKGARKTLADLNIHDPKTAPETMVILLAKAIDNCMAKTIDNGKDADKLSGLSREYRQWLEEVRNQPTRANDKVGALIDRQ